jgi:hypothetical protein
MHSDTNCSAHRAQDRADRIATALIAAVIEWLRDPELHARIASRLRDEDAETRQDLINEIRRGLWPDGD